MLNFSQHCKTLSESKFNITNGEIIKIMRATKAEIAKLRKSKMKADQYDADHLEYSFMPALNTYNPSRIASSMSGGETETRETMFRIVSKVVGRDKASALSRM